MPSPARTDESAEVVTGALKIPPHSIEAEQAVLGGLMLDNEAWAAVAERVGEADFYRHDHRLIFRAIGALAEAAKPCDVATVAEWLEHAGELDKAGGLPFIAALAEQTPTAANVVAHADIVRSRSVLRQLIRAGSSISDMAFRPEGRANDELLDEAERLVFEIAEQHARGRAGYLPIKQLLTGALDRIDELYTKQSPITGVATGFNRFDSMTSGLQRADLVIIAGRPSMGKCLACDSELVLDDGAVVAIEDLHRHGRGRRVGTLNDDFRLDRATPSDYVDDGVKPEFEVLTRLGRRVETTLPHPFLTISGWKPLAELRVGDAVAVPRTLPVFGDGDMRECEIKLLAYLIGDGGLTGNTARFTSSNPAIAADFATAVQNFGGLRLTRSENRAGFAPSWRVAADAGQVRAARGDFAFRLTQRLTETSISQRQLALAVGVSPSTITHWKQGETVPDSKTFVRLCEVLRVTPDGLAPGGVAAAQANVPNPLVRWLSEHGLMGKASSQKIIPPVVFRLKRPQLAQFLSCLFATDGWATVLKSGQAQLGYATVNEKLARQVQHLLLRFGVIASLRLRWVRYREARRPSWQLDITHADSILTFAREIGIFGKEEALEAAVRAVAQRRRQMNRDLVPVEVWSLLEKAKGTMSWSGLARKAGVPESNIHVHRRALSRARLARFALALGDRHLLNLANSDVYWDRIVSITPAGQKQVYDLTIAGTHNFIANDMCVHNTALALNIAEHAAIKDNLPVAIFSMEMPGEQLAMRMMSSLGRIDQLRVRTGKLHDEDWPRLTSAVQMLSETRMFVDDTPALTPGELRARCRRLAREHGLGLVVVDYLQLMQVPGTKENRATEISEISRSLKALAKELNVPIVALSQLNRGLESRTDKRPVMSDLRESGAIEQDADLIVFIYRDEVYNENSEQKGIAEIIIGKQRNGPIGKIELAFLGQFTRFENLAHDDYSA